MTKELLYSVKVARHKCSQIKFQKEFLSTRHYGSSTTITGAGSTVIDQQHANTVIDGQLSYHGIIHTYVYTYV